MREPRNDLLTHLLRAEVDGRSLIREEILDICYLLLLGGMDTTRNALGCAFAFLATHPDHRRQIVTEPDVVPAAVEEMLRWESPTTAVRRYLVQDTDIGGCRLAAGQRIDVALASANTDEDHILDAFTVDFHRRPNNHLAFGAGVHRCLGAQLARLELRIALREWHRRIPEYGLAPGARPHYALGGTLRYVDQLSLTWPPADGRML
jgi:cytochrome P450